MPRWADGSTRGASTTRTSHTGASGDAWGFMVSLILGLQQRPEGLLPRLRGGDLAQLVAVELRKARPLAPQPEVDLDRLLQQVVEELGVALIERRGLPVGHGDDHRVVLGDPV